MHPPDSLLAMDPFISRKELISDTQDFSKSIRRESDVKLAGSAIVRTEGGF